jgi:hypothetical protein
MGVEVTSCDMDDQSEMKRDAIAKVIQKLKFRLMNY